jgi:hypothetical protein
MTCRPRPSVQAARAAVRAAGQQGGGRRPASCRRGVQPVLCVLHLTPTAAHLQRRDAVAQHDGQSLAHADGAHGVVAVACGEEVRRMQGEAPWGFRVLGFRVCHGASAHAWTWQERRVSAG